MPPEASSTLPAVISTPPQSTAQRPPMSLSATQPPSSDSRYVPPKYSPTMALPLWSPKPRPPRPLAATMNRMRIDWMP